MADTEKRRRLREFLLQSSVGIPAAAGSSYAGELIRKQLSRAQWRRPPDPFAPEERGRPFLTHPRVVARKHPGTTWSTARDVAEEMKRKKVNIPITTGFPSETRYLNKWPTTPTRIIVSKPAAGIAMHEIGHASRPAGGAAWRELVFRTSSEGFPREVAGVDLIRAGIFLGALHEPDEKHKISRFVYEHAPAMVGLTYLPRIAEEMRATGSAVRGAYILHKMHGVKELLHDVGLGQLSYLAPAAAAVGGVMAARALARHIHQKMEKKSAQLPTEPKMQGQLRLSTTQANMTPIGQLKPKTTPAHPGEREGNFRGTPSLSPPSLTKYYRDFTQSLVPGRGARQ